MGNRLACCGRGVAAVPAERDVPPADGPPMTALGSLTVRWRSPCGMPGFFPCYGVRAPCLRDFDRMRPHEELRDAGSLAEWRAGDGHLLFFSHQWTAFDEPDPTGIQFKVIRDFLADDDAIRMLLCRRHSAIVKYGRKRSRTLKDAQLDAQSPSGPYDPDRGFCWLDIWSIPQASPSDQSLAIQSIAAYVTLASLMMVVAPPCTHANTGDRCDITSWRSRGWCRLEELAFCFKDFGAKDSARIFILDEAGGGPRSDTTMLGGPRKDPDSSVLRGEFTCCKRGHRSANGEPLPCDKETLARVAGYLEDTFADRLLDKGDMLAYRRLVSSRWARMCEEPPAVSAEALLSKLRIASATAKLEGPMYAVHYAAYSNNPVAIAELLEQRADIEALDDSDNTPLHLAAMTNAPLAAKALIDAGADVNALNMYGASPVILSTFPTGTEVLRLLIERRGDVHVKLGSSTPMIEHRGASALHGAAFFGRQGAVDLLLEARADPMDRQGEGGPLVGLTAPELATRSGHDLLFFRQ